MEVLVVITGAIVGAAIGTVLGIHCARRIFDRRNWYDKHRL